MEIQNSCLTMYLIGTRHDTLHFDHVAAQRRVGMRA